jgi:hypothetical protein
MAQNLPDLVRDSKLDIQVSSDDPSLVIQTEFIPNPELRQRWVPVKQTWKTVKELGVGSYATVWMTECISGPAKGQLRAVKHIQKEKAPDGSSVNYQRELEAIFKFTQKPVRNRSDGYLGLEICLLTLW